MSLIFPSLYPLSTNFKGILLDAYGVFWGGNERGLLPGSQEAMARLAHSRFVGILSNSTQLPEKEREKFERHGLVQGKHYHFLMTSGQIARTIFLNQQLPFATPRKTFWLFGGIHPRFASHEAIFKDSDFHEVVEIDEADFIYLSTPHIGGDDQRDPELFRSQIAAICGKNLPMVCPNPDRFAHEGNPPQAVVRQGSLAKMYEELGGEVFYIGKPYDKAYAAAFEQFSLREALEPQEILMVGDTPETDIRGAHLFGMKSALVTQTGIMGDRIVERGLEQALSELPEGDRPDFLIERL